MTRRSVKNSYQAILFSVAFVGGTLSAASQNAVVTRDFIACATVDVLLEERSTGEMIADFCGFFAPGQHVKLMHSKSSEKYQFFEVEYDGEESEGPPQFVTENKPGLFKVSRAPNAKLDTIYTEVSRCRSLDKGPDEYVHLCEGPTGIAAVLHYVDGKAIIVFGRGGGNRGDELSGTPFNANDAPIPVGGSDKVFGPKIEWILSSGKPCAAILRVSTNQGSRLITTAIGPSKGRLSTTKENEAARMAAAATCAG
ncbi:hypothetical protein FHS21_002802 [Phyllobacterium trifolii]|uniref:Uncharacterized protein n=1 Tax=Phyllobacterium trifolii TaxID=300193 RepID=A0A839U7A1_9HYPH|nr:hypothetical protein [Phyllobacterium trifolii]MBB3146387.1 hypothetical protein [Phyllobacterium trifolii]